MWSHVFVKLVLIYLNACMYFSFRYRNLKLLGFVAMRFELKCKDTRMNLLKSDDQKWFIEGTSCQLHSDYILIRFGTDDIGIC